MVTGPPLKISDGLLEGCYIAQPVEPYTFDYGAAGVLYATTAGNSPPDDLADWFRCQGHNAFFEFTVNNLQPTWVRVADPHRGPVTLALARR